MDEKCLYGAHQNPAALAISHAQPLYQSGMGNELIDLYLVLGSVQSSTNP
jgi:hypothetical protein